MTLRIAGRIDMDGRAAQQSVRQTGAAVDRLKTSVQQSGTAARQAEAATSGLAAAQSRAAQTAQVMGRANTAAAGSVANLTAQFNDIGVMLAAGQNPLQLAVQQGTQINQVFSQLGGGSGAIRAVGQAFLSMLSPINLITIATIAAGAAATQWLMGPPQQAASFEDELERTLDAMGRLRELNASFSLDGIEALRAKYGQVTAEVALLIQRRAELEQAEAPWGARAALGDEYGHLLSRLDLTGRAGPQGVKMIADELGLSRDQALAFRDVLGDLGAARTFEEMRGPAAVVLDILEGSTLEGGELWRQMLDVQDAALQGRNTLASWGPVLGGLIGSAATLGATLRDAAAAAVQDATADAEAGTDASGNATPFAPGSRARSAPRRAPALIGEPRVSTRGGGAGGGGLAVNVNNDLRGANGSEEITRAVAQGVRAGIAEYDRRQLPLSIRRVNADPRRIG